MRIIVAALFFLSTAAVPAAAQAKLPPGPLISVWEHSAKVDISDVIAKVGFNTVWTHDRPYSGEKLEDTLMHRHLQTPGVEYVIAKIERSIWGWNHEQSLKHAEWIANLSLKEKKIIGVYMNDFYGEIEAREKTPEKGGRTPEQWREIIAKLRSINPKLAIWLPCYPPNEFKYPFDYDFDAVITSIYNTRQIPNAERLLKEVKQKFPDKPVMVGLYLNAGSERRWITEEEFKQLMDLFVRQINEGNMIGLRVFRVESLQERPEYASWAKEALSKLKRR